MKRIFLLGSLCGFFALALPAMELRVGAVASGLTFWGGEVLLEGAAEWFDDLVVPEFGLEAGMAGSVPRTLVPLGLAAEAYLEDGWSVGAAAHGLLGAAFAGSTPAFLWGGELELRTEYARVPGVAFGASVAARYLGAAWEFPVRLMVEIPVGGHDHLEVNFDDDEGSDHHED